MQLQQLYDSNIIYSEGVHTIKIAINHQEFTIKFPCGAKMKLQSYTHTFNCQILYFLNNHRSVSFFLWCFQL